MTNMPFTKFLMELRNGEFEEFCSEQFEDLLSAIAEHDAPGEIDLKIKIAPDKKGDHVTVTPTCKIKKPERRIRSAIGWIGDDGQFTRDHPKQRDIEEFTGAGGDGSTGLRSIQ